LIPVVTLSQVNEKVLRGIGDSIELGLKTGAGGEKIRA